MSTSAPPPPPDGRSEPAADDPLQRARGRGPEPAVLYAIIGLLVILLLMVVYLLGRANDEAADVVVVEPTITVAPTPSTTPTPTPTPIVLVSPTDDPSDVETPEGASGSEPVIPPSEPGTAPPTPPAVPEATSPAQPAQPTSGSADDDPDDPGVAVAEDGRSLFPVVDDELATFEGLQITGSGVRVQSVVEGTGFWIGTAEGNRAFVIYDDGGRAEAYAPAAGDRVDLNGPMVAVGEEVVLDGEDGGAQLARQGVAVRVEVISPAG